MLLVVQVAASLSLVASAGLILKSVSALDRRDPGFDAERVMAFSVAEDLAVQRPGSGPLLVDRLLTGLRGISGVEAITAAQCTPFGSRCARLGFWLEGQPQTTANMLVTGWHRVGPDHFGALKIPIVRGRGFTADDRRGRPQVVVISDAAARRFFPDRDPIGLRITLPEVVEGDPEMAEIVGIVGDVTYWPLDEAPGPAMYQPALQFSHPFTTVMVRVSEQQWRRSMLGETSQPMFETLRRALAGIDPNLPMFDLTSMNELARAGRADRRFVSALLERLCVLRVAAGGCRRLRRDRGVVSEPAQGVRGAARARRESRQPDAHGHGRRAMANRHWRDRRYWHWRWPRDGRFDRSCLEWVRTIRQR